MTKDDAVVRVRIAVVAVPGVRASLGTTAFVLLREPWGPGDEVRADET